ncbi:MAG TPA: S41 family peptidase [Thiotrichaceae bacterium]|jgi:carboxyl-terminal processing protease|nr:S41 family peptidase [Thiotrichaceae bacterium]HIM07412.1 S41 family peptidase [Gammaproteobacteria bacterium]
MYKIKGLIITFLLSIFSVSVVTANTEENTDLQSLPLEEIRTFTEVFAKIKHDYVESVDDRQLLEDAIRGMLQGLDPHSTYLDRESYKDLQEGTSGEFGGLGIEVGMEDGFIKVISPIDGTPAEESGIEAGDLIIRLDSKTVKGMSLNEAVDLMRGKPGTDIILTILREGEEAPLEITLTRAIITAKSIISEILEPGFGYVRISSFQTHTAEDLRRSLDKLKEKNKNSLSGLILDLRNNPGGILNAAVGVSDLFLDNGLIVYTEGRIQDSKLKFNAKPSDILKDAPLIVLVNGGSASASEIVAGALQDHDRAIIMGERTFGKGSVQTILPMNDNAALKLTTARYFTPSGRSIQALGIEPDIIIENIRVNAEKNTNPMRIKEADLSGHLGNGNKESETEEGVSNDEDADLDKNQDQKKENKPSLAETDYQLYEALNVLKGLVIHMKKVG